MKILIVSATEKEIIPLINSLAANSPTNEANRYVYKSLIIDILITGIGSVFTTFNLIQKISKNNYDLVINAGIAGSFSSFLKIGDVVYVHSDQFADLGIEDENSLYTIFDKGFISANAFPFQNGLLINPIKLNNSLIAGLKQVDAITVNTTHGRKESIEFFKHKYDPDIETMEGAAVFYVCLQQHVRFLQIRAISNYVRLRKKAEWDIPLAIENLNKKLFELLVVLEIDSH
ncbi:MAG: futalosine hydrolase [Bacteroidales bacterium]